MGSFLQKVKTLIITTLVGILWDDLEPTIKIKIKRTALIIILNAKQMLEWWDSASTTNAHESVAQPQHCI